MRTEDASDLILGLARVEGVDGIEDRQRQHARSAHCDALPAQSLRKSRVDDKISTQRTIAARDTAPSVAASAGFVQREICGTFAWDQVKRLRDLWPRALVIKGVLHPMDAEKAVAIGADGILVSNHGGRQSDAAPASMDVLPAIVAAVDTRTTLLFDSGVRSGLDVARAIALGARAAFCGRAFLFGVGALGNVGSSYVAELLVDEFRTAMAQHGAATLDQLRNAEVKHNERFMFREER